MALIYNIEKYNVTHIIEINSIEGSKAIYSIDLKNTAIKKKHKVNSYTQNEYNCEWLVLTLYVN